MKKVLTISLKKLLTVGRKKLLTVTEKDLLTLPEKKLLDIHTEKAVDEMFKYSAGAARAVNKLATHALMYAAQRAKKLIDDHMIRTVIAGELP